MNWRNRVNWEQKSDSRKVLNWYLCRWSHLEHEISNQEYKVILDFDNYRTENPSDVETKSLLLIINDGVNAIAAACIGERASIEARENHWHEEVKVNHIRASLKSLASVNFSARMALVEKLIKNKGSLSLDQFDEIVAQTHKEITKGRSS